MYGSGSRMQSLVRWTRQRSWHTCNVYMQARDTEHVRNNVLGTRYEKQKQRREQERTAEGGTGRERREGENERKQEKM